MRRILPLIDLRPGRIVSEPGSTIGGALERRYLISMGSHLTEEYIAQLRRMTGEQKWHAAFRLYWGARMLKAAALREQHPDWSAEQIEQKVKEIFLHART